jgi:hypothetical protein
MKMVWALLSLVLAVAACSGTGEAPSAQPAAQISDEAAAAAALQAINQAQQDFIRRTRRYALTFSELIEARLLGERPAKEILGYDITLRPAADAVSYTVHATPLMPGPLSRHLFTDNTGIIRVQENQAATAESPPR